MVYNNSSNINVTGIVAADGAGAFNGRTVTGTADFIDVTNGDGVAGNPVMSIAENFERTGMDSWNGSVLETAAVTVTSDGATITCSVEQSGGGDLTVVFSDGYYVWDTTPADTVTLTAGSDTSPQINYVYFLQSNKTLTASTAGWPATEHAPMCTAYCQSAASLQTEGPYKVHVWTDHVTKTNDQGHISDINFWIRQQPATWVSGVTQTYSIAGGPPNNVLLTTADGVVLQLHDHAFPAFAGTPDIYVFNDSVTPYTVITDLNTIAADSTGATLVGKFYSLVIWGCVSEDTGDCKLFCNLPNGSYNNSTGVEDDADNFAVYTIPPEFTGTGFLISEWKLRQQAAGGGTFTSIAEIDLRGLLPSLTAGGGGAAATEFIDNVFRILNVSDSTKEIAFDAVNITTTTTRTITMLDADIDLANVVQGPASATDDALAKYDSTTGKLVQNSVAILTDAGALSGLTLLDVDNVRVDGNVISSTNTNGNVNITPNGTGIISQSKSVAGGNVALSIANNSNTASSQAYVEILSGASATDGDTFFRVAKSAFRAYCWGWDDDDGDALKMNTHASSAVTPSTGTNLWKMTTAGERIMPLQPAWNGYVSGVISNVTGDGTVYTVLFNAELFDQNADFDTSTGTFTAPVAGKYSFNVNVALAGITSSHTSGIINIVTTPRAYTIWAGNPFAMSDTSGQIAINGAIVVEMAATNTATVTVTVSGGTAVVDVQEFFTLGTNFAGFLAC